MCGIGALSASNVPLVVDVLGGAVPIRSRDSRHVIMAHIDVVKQTRINKQKRHIENRERERRSYDEANVRT